MSTLDFKSMHEISSAFSEKTNLAISLLNTILPSSYIEDDVFAKSVKGRNRNIQYNKPKPL